VVKYVFYVFLNLYLSHDQLWLMLVFTDLFTKGKLLTHYITDWFIYVTGYTV